MTSQVFAFLASASLIGAGLASAGETRAAQALPVLTASSADGADRLCRVDVIRTGDPGSAVINRIEDRSRCVCVITTGPQDRNGSAEAIVNALLRDRTCDGAPKLAVQSSSAGGTGGIIGLLAGGLGAGGGIAVAGGSDSAG